MGVVSGTAGAVLHAGETGTLPSSIATGSDVRPSQAKEPKCHQCPKFWNKIYMPC